MGELTAPNVQQLLAAAADAAAPHRITVTIEDKPRPRLVVAYETDSYYAPQYYLGAITEEVLTDLIAYFTNSPIDERTDMNIFSTDLFTYLAGDMIGQSTIQLTISGVTLENMNSGKGGQQTKPCLHFKERSKLMVLNKTNAKALAGELGPETENWVGARVTIAAPIVDAFGKSARSLRIIGVEAPPAMRAPKPRATTAAAKEIGQQADWLDGDDDSEARREAALATAQGAND